MISLEYYKMLVSHYLSYEYEVDEILSMIKEAEILETVKYLSVYWKNGAVDIFLKVKVNLKGGSFVCLKYVDDGD